MTAVSKRLGRVFVSALAVIIGLSLPLPTAAGQEQRALPYPEVVAEPRFDISADAPASLFNIVERMSAWRVPGDTTDPRYLRFWSAAIGMSDEDREFFSRYRALRRRFRGGIPAGGLVDRLAGMDLPFPIQLESVRFEDKLALLFLWARDWDEVERGARLLLTAHDEAELMAIFGHFRDRFAWVERRALYLAAYRARALSWFETARPEAFLARLANFFANPPEHVARFQLQLTWLPEGEGESRAFVVEDSAALEVADGFGLRQVMDVAVHELAHRLHERMPHDLRRKLERAFVDHPSAKRDGALAVAAANLWWESLATAVGQGVFARLYFPHSFNEERPWYEDPGYDSLARAIEPLVARYLDESRTLDTAFIRSLVAAYRELREKQAAGEGGAPDARPADLARRAILLHRGPEADALAGAAAAVVRDATRPRLLLEYGPTERAAAARAVDSFPGLPIFIFVTDAGRHEIGPDLELAGISPKTLPKGELVVMPRPRAGPMVVVSGPDSEAVIDSWRRYLARP